MNTDTTEVVEAEAVEVDEHGTPVRPAEHTPAQELVPVEAAAMVTRSEITVDDLVGQSAKITAAMEQAMTSGVHYGVITGVSKPSLFKPGAEKLLVLFRLAPHYAREVIWGPGDHMTAIVTCTLKHAPTGMIVATGEGMCSSRESRYAYRAGGRLCPECGQPAIIKGKKEYGGGWLCYGKKGGCGAKWTDDSAEGQAFEEADTGRTENPDLPDTWNTVLKMADKRSLVAAILNGTAASDVFTQDVEDTKGDGAPSDDAGDVKAADTAVDMDTFEPGNAILAGAIQGRGAPARIVKALEVIHGGLVWPAIMEQILQDVFGVSTTEELTGPRRNEFWRRLSNAVWRINDQASPDAVPPASDDLIRGMLAWAFEGTAVTLYTPDDLRTAEELEEAASAAASDDIPWTADVQQALDAKAELEGAATGEEPDGAASD